LKKHEKEKFVFQISTHEDYLDELIRNLADEYAIQVIPLVVPEIVGMKGSDSGVY
jgi:hypothetical protein